MKLCAWLVNALDRIAGERELQKLVTHGSGVNGHGARLGVRIRFGTVNIISDSIPQEWPMQSCVSSLRILPELDRDKKSS